MRNIKRVRRTIGFGLFMAITAMTYAYDIRHETCSQKNIWHINKVSKPENNKKTNTTTNYSTGIEANKEKQITQHNQRQQNQRTVKPKLRHNPLEPGGWMTVTMATLQKLINTIQEIITTDPFNKINLKTKEKWRSWKFYTSIGTITHKKIYYNITPQNKGKSPTLGAAIRVMIVNIPGIQEYLCTENNIKYQIDVTRTVLPTTKPLGDDETADTPEPTPKADNKRPTTSTIATTVEEMVATDPNLSYIQEGESREPTGGSDDDS